jgi:hypothetical protein
MAGNSDQKIRQARGAAPLDYRFERQRFSPKVDSRGIRGQRDIQPVVDQDTRTCRARFSNRETRDLHKSARIKILLTNLNPAGSGRGRAPNGIVKRAPAKRTGISRERIGWNKRAFQREPVCYIAEYWFTSGWQGSPSVPAACSRPARYPGLPNRSPPLASKDEEETESTRGTCREKNCDPNTPARERVPATLQAEKYPG